MDEPDSSLLANPPWVPAPLLMSSAEWAGPGSPGRYLELQPRALPKLIPDRAPGTPSKPENSSYVLNITLCLFQRLGVTDGETEAQRVGGWIKVPLKGKAQTEQKLGPQPGFSNSHVYAFVVLCLAVQPHSSSLKTPSSEGGFLPQRVPHLGTWREGSIHRLLPLG